LSYIFQRNTIGEGLASSRPVYKKQLIKAGLINLVWQARILLVGRADP